MGEDKRKPRRTPTPANDCANWQPSGKCLGIMFRDDGSQWMSASIAGKSCLIKAGKQCRYWNECVLGSVRSRRAVAV